MRVCQLIQGLAIGGLERVVVDLCRGLDRRRFAPLVCCYDALGPLFVPLAAAGVPAVLEPRQPGKDWRFSLRLARRLRRLRVDVLHAHNQTAFFYGVLAGRLAGVRRIVYTEHDRNWNLKSQISNLKSGISSSGPPAPLLDRFLALLTDRVFSVSAAVRECFAASARIPRRRIAVAYNGVDGARFHPCADPAVARAALGLPEAPTVGIVARLSPEKNHSLLFAAFSRVGSGVWGSGSGEERSAVGDQPSADQQPNPSPAARGGELSDSQSDVPGPRLLIVGDGPERPRLTAEAARMGIADRTHFLGARDDVPQCLAAMDVVVLCSTTEGLPLTPIEAMAAGRPAIVTDVGGCRELVMEGETGFVVPSGDATALAARLDRLLVDASLRRRLGAAARQRFADRFSLERMVATYENAYLAPEGA